MADAPNNVRSEAIEDAMTAAVLECLAEGITDPEVILARKLEAREAVVGGGG